MIFFKDGPPAYITKRFDVKPNGEKWGKEDFATLARKTKDSVGADFKYAYSYEEAGLLIQKYVPAWRVEIEKYFSLVVFNYLFSNGDAHLKNFSLLESTSGDYLLCPAYDLINTRLHVDDTDFALDKGLFADDYKSEAHKKHGHAGKTDFAELAKRIGISENRADKLLSVFLEKQPFVETLVKQSFLSEANRRGYYLMYETRLNSLVEK
jgi:serine/threonine-protein kinase HipA